MSLRAGESVIDIAARLIAAIGRRDFPARMLGACRDLAGCDLCAAFDLSQPGGPRLLFAEGAHPQIPGFAQAASRAYAERYWRRDDALQACGRSGGAPGGGAVSAGESGGGVLVRLTAEDIRDPNYRRDCYEQAGVVERLTLVDGALLVSGYRMAGSGFATPAERERIAAVGPALLAALRRHDELSSQPIADQRLDCRRAMVARARGWGLSDREAHVAAGMADGDGQTEIAETYGLALSSVVTYRKRAYKKLNVPNRRALRALFGTQGGARLPVLSGGSGAEGSQE